MLFFNRILRIKIKAIIVLPVSVFFISITGCTENSPDTTFPDRNRVIASTTDRTGRQEIKENKFGKNVAGTRTYIIGKSVKGTPLVVTDAGNGKEIGLVIIGSLHGNEYNTKILVAALESIYHKNQDFIPSHMSLFFLPAVNPDGVTYNTRRNARNVDLNRNFPTEDWKSDAISPNKQSVGSGGISPGSEPEIRALTKWLLEYVKQAVEHMYVISFHSSYPPTGAVQPGYRIYGDPGPESEEFARFISRETGYKFLHTWISSSRITGEFIHWCEMNNIWSCDIELPDYNSPSVIPHGKKEPTYATFRKLLQELLYDFFSLYSEEGNGR